MCFVVFALSDVGAGVLRVLLGQYVRDYNKRQVKVVR